MHHKVQWKLPNFESEKFELERYIKSGAKQKPCTFNTIAQASERFHAGLIHDIPINPNKLKNFDYTIIKESFLNNIPLRDIIEYYHRKGKSSYYINDIYIRGGVIDRPVLFDLKNEYYELVSGNTRIVLASIMQISVSYLVI